MQVATPHIESAGTPTSIAERLWCHLERKGVANVTMNFRLKFLDQSFERFTRIDIPMRKFDHRMALRTSWGWDGLTNKIFKERPRGRIVNMLERGFAVCFCTRKKTSEQLCTPLSTFGVPDDALLVHLLRQGLIFLQVLKATQSQNSSQQERPLRQGERDEGPGQHGIA
eukprot:39426-Amphidinium_carterae.1